jgi:hypothetical protein
MTSLPLISNGEEAERFAEMTIKFPASLQGI